MSAILESATPTPSEQPPPASDNRLIAGRFRLLEPLGRGGMGRVYRARDELLGRLVAVKLIYDDAIIDSDVRHACALEARAAARLNHPGIVRILDSGFDDGHLYVVMSLAEGRTLADVLREEGPLPAARALDLAMQVADALEAAHLEGIVHCDVKPSNLIVRPNGTVQLVDFGIAKIAASTTSLDSSTLQGSAEYVAPEQVEGSAVDGRTDLYALGVVLYEALAGRTPFGGGTIASVLARRLVNDPPPIRDAVPQVPISVDRVLRRMLARDPADRFQAASQVRAALADARREVIAASLPPPPAASLTATMPIDRRQTGAAAARAGRRARAGVTRQAARFRAAYGRATVLIASTALATLRHGRWLVSGARPLLSGGLVFGKSGASRRGRRPSLLSGVGIAVMVGLLIGTAAARCSVAGASADGAIGPAAASVHASPTSAVPPTIVPVIQAPATQAPPPPTAAPAATPPPPTSEPSPETVTATNPDAAPEPPAASEPAASAQTLAAPPPAVVPPAEVSVPQVQPLAAPATAPVRGPSRHEKQPDPPAPRPEAKPSGRNGPSGQDDKKQDSKPRGNGGNGNGNGPQKKR